MGVSEEVEMAETTLSTPRQAQRATGPSAGDSLKFAKPGLVADPIGYANWVRRRYGSTIRLRDLVWAIWSTADSTLVREIFQGEPRQLRAGEVNALMEPVASPRSIPLLDEPDHMRVRSVGSKPGLRSD